MSFLNTDTGSSFWDIINIVLSFISAVGSIATVITLVITLRKIFGKLKIKGKLSIKHSGHYYIDIYNNRSFDSEVESILFVKGNPRFLNSCIFGSLNNDCYKEMINSKNNFVIPKNDYISIDIPTKNIISNYESIGESLGKPYDTIYISVNDNRGNSYYIKTGYNIDFFKRISET